LTMTITTASGLFSGGVTVTNGIRQTLRFNGALHQKQNWGYGLFLGPSQTGLVFFGPLLGP